MKNIRPVIDANVLIHAYNEASIRFGSLSKLLEDLLSKNGFSVTPQILNEFFSIITDERKTGKPLISPWQHPDTYSAFHLYVVRLKLNEIQKTRRESFDLLRKSDIGVNVHYIPVHLHPYYQKLDFYRSQFPEAEKHYEEAITLPLHPTMTCEEQDHIINTLKRILN